MRRALINALLAFPGRSWPSRKQNAVNGLGSRHDVRIARQCRFRPGSVLSRRTIAEAVRDSSLFSAALRGAAEVQSVYFGCADSSFALLRRAHEASQTGDRLRDNCCCAGRGQRELDEARAVHTAMYADLKGKVPRAITRESVGFLMGQAAIQRAAKQHSAARNASAGSTIADRLANGDVAETAAAQAPH